MNTGTHDPARLVVLAPNWLGDFVMALPAIADLRRAFPRAHISIAARESVAGLVGFIPGIDGCVVFGSDARGFHVKALAAETFDTALLLPNSFRAAWLAWRAGIANRWGYRADGRTWLLTRALRKPAGAHHHGDYYRHLTRALGIDSGPVEPRLDNTVTTRSAAQELLRSHGYDGRSPLVAVAPGAAYGRAKQWIPAHVAALISSLSTSGITCVLVGSQGDAETGRAVRTALTGQTNARVIDLIGKTTLDLLIGVLTVSDVCVSNDSGAMHLAAAIGTRVVGIFGPTDERHSSPTTHPDRAAVVLTNPVWCRPCMLRECPIDHSCMTGIAPERVCEAVFSLLANQQLRHRAPNLEWKANTN